MRFPKIHLRSRSVEASGQLLTVQTVIRQRKTYPVLPRSLSPVHHHVSLQISSFFFSMQTVAAVSLFTPNVTFLNIFPGTVDCKPFNLRIYPASYSLSLHKLSPGSCLEQAQSYCAHFFIASAATASLLFSVLKSCFPLLSSRLSRSNSEFCGCNETLRCPLRVRGHDVNVGVAALCMHVKVMAGKIG